MCKLAKRLDQVARMTSSSIENASPSSCNSRCMRATFASMSGQKYFFDCLGHGSSFVANIKTSDPLAGTAKSSASGRHKHSAAVLHYSHDVSNDRVRGRDKTLATRSLPQEEGQERRCIQVESSPRHARNLSGVWAVWPNELLAMVWATSIFRALSHESSAAWKAL